MTILLYHLSIIELKKLPLFPVARCSQTTISHKVHSFHLVPEKTCSFCILQDHLVESSNIPLIQLSGKREKALRSETAQWPAK
jgi:hypothetical protein